MVCENVVVRDMLQRSLGNEVEMLLPSLALQRTPLKTPAALLRAMLTLKVCQTCISHLIRCQQKEFLGLEKIPLRSLQNSFFPPG